MSNGTNITNLGTYWTLFKKKLDFPCGSADKESTCNARELGLIPGLERSPGEGKGSPLQYSGLENPMDCILHGVTKSWTQLSNFYFHLKKNTSLNFLKGQHILLPCFGCQTSLDSPDVSVWKPWLSNRQAVLKRLLHLEHCIEPSSLSSSCPSSFLLVVPLISEQNSWSSSTSPASLPFPVLASS